MDPPGWFDGVHLDEIARHGRFSFFPSVCEGLEVRPWLPEFHSCCITLLLDKVLEAVDADRFNIYCLTDDEFCPVESGVGLGTLELQSSGVRYVGSFQHESRDVMVLEIDRKLAKKDLAVPDNVRSGFTWYNPDASDAPIPCHPIPSESVGSIVSLTFAVSGEFNLSMFLVKDEETEPRFLFSKGFCCK